MTDETAKPRRDVIAGLNYLECSTRDGGQWANREVNSFVCALLAAQPVARCGQCHKCLEGQTFDMGGKQWPITAARMVLCVICGNKRCPHATDCALACTDSNEPGQFGSAYTAHGQAEETPATERGEGDR